MRHLLVLLFAFFHLSSFAGVTIDTGTNYLMAEGVSLTNADPTTGSTYDVRYGEGYDWVTYAGWGYGVKIFCTATEFGIDPAPTRRKSCWYKPHVTGTFTGQNGGGAPPPEPAPTPASGIDWSKTSHLLQAMVVLGVLGLFLMGYRSGDKV